MTLLASILDQNVLSMLPEPVIQEWNDQLRNLDRKLSNAIIQLKTEDSIIKKEKTQLDAKIKALTEENEKLKTELATGSAVSVVNNVEHLLKGLETRLNQSNITLGESINKKLLNNISMMQQHTNVTKITHKSVVASMEVINARLKDSMDRLNSLHCMQMLSDSSTGSVAYGEEVSASCDILEVCMKKTKPGDVLDYPFIYMKKTAKHNYRAFEWHIVKHWRIRLGSPILVYVSDHAAKRTPFKLDEWSIHMARSQRIEITWLDSKVAYEFVCFV